MLGVWGDWLAIPLTLAYAVVVAVFSGHGKRAGVGLSLLSFGLPWLAEAPTVRFVVSMGAAVTFLRALDLRADSREWSLSRRFWLALSVFDSRQVSFETPCFDVRNVVQALAFTTLGCAGFAALITWGEQHVLVRWSTGVVFVYCAPEAIHAAVIAACSAFGVRVPVFHDLPILSRTVAEFWGRRWNRIIHEALARHVFRRLARRRRPRLAVLATFAASALMHFWFVAASLDLYWACWMGSFFVVQGGIVMLERRIGVVRWPPVAAHAWTVTTIVGTAPLFIEPLLRVVETAL